MTEILVVGGAGYIGSHMCKYLSKQGYTPIVLDSLVMGHREAVQWGPIYQGCMSNAEVLDQIFTNHAIKVVMHFAAFCYVGESVTKPLIYYHNNVNNTVRLLESMLRHDVERFIFSSSCATYGKPKDVPITESQGQKPINPYGKTKLIVEQMLEDFESAYGLRSISLRYFNAAGADPDGEIGESHDPETHLIPLVIQTALGIREEVQVFGNDYPTPDGTCVRDYIHVNDLAQAHLLAMEMLLNGHPSDQYNLGIGEGYSVNEVIERVGKTTGKRVPVRITERRAGDPPILIASNKKATEELGWKPCYSDLNTVIETAWNWHQNYSKGF